MVRIQNVNNTMLKRAFSCSIKMFLQRVVSKVNSRAPPRCNQLDILAVECAYAAFVMNTFLLLPSVSSCYAIHKLNLSSVNVF